MGEEPALTAAVMAHHAGFDLTLPQSIILVFDESLVPRVRRRSRRPSSHPFRRIAELDDGLAVVCAAGPGAPSAAVAIEFIAAFGAQRVVSVGTAGDLHGRVSGTHPVGATVSDEGTSPHYGTDTSPDPSIVAALAEVTSNQPLTALTTDVPFRHTPTRLKQHRDVADVVEMECAAIFAVARARDLRAGSLVVISDHFEDSTWRLNDRTATRTRLDEAVALATATLSR